MNHDAPPSFEKEIKKLQERVAELEALEAGYIKTNNTLIESEKKFRKLFDESPSGIALIDSSGVLLEANKKLIEMQPLKKEELIGKSFLEIASGFGIDTDELLDDFRKRLAGDLSAASEMTYPGIDGHHKTISIQSSLITLGDRTTGVIFIINDITGKKLIEEALRESEKKFRIIVENAPDIIFRWKPGFGVEYINPVVTEIIGYSPDEIVGNLGFLVSKIHPDDRKVFMDTLNNLREKTPLMKPVEFRIVSKDNKSVWIEARLIPLMDDNGNFASLKCIARDITDRRSAEKAALESSKIINRSPVVVFLWKNEQGWPIEFVSDNVINLFGYSTEEFTSGTITYEETLHPDDRNRVYEEVAAHSSEPDRKEFTHMPYRIVTRNDEIKWVEDRTFIRRDESGAITHYQGIVLDITDRICAEEEREKLQEQIFQIQKMDAFGDLAGGVAHDFNNMLAVITGNANLALAYIKQGDQGYFELREIKDAVNRAKELTMKLLTFARKDETNAREVHISTIIDELVSILERTFLKRVRIETSMLDDPLLNVDSNRIQQALMSICKNSFDAMPGGGTLTIECSVAMPAGRQPAECADAKPGQCCLIRITDTGIGMPEIIIPKIFDPFFTTKSAGKGTGLGLSVTHGIVANHGGHIDVQSEPGRGTTMNVYLPLATGSEKNTGDNIPADTMINEETILIVDDEKQLLKTIEKNLNLSGYKTLAADSGKKAIKLYRPRRNEIDLVLLDMIMPEMNGMQVIQALKEINPDVRIIILSGYSEFGGAESPLKEKCVKKFIHKPCDMLELCEAIRQVLDGD
ncbi:MAG TPA: PAS domain S-box protein [bacterium]|nr:PAS domain S-box protein [bacterium]